MDAGTIHAAAAVGVPLLAAGVWLLRLEGRLNTHEASCEQRQKNLDERHAVITKTLESIDGKLDYLMEQR